MEYSHPPRHPAATLVRLLTCVRLLFDLCSDLRRARAPVLRDFSDTQRPQEVPSTRRATGTSTVSALWESTTYSTVLG